MSWNNQGGPWTPKGQGPWGGGPAGAPSPGDIEDAIRRLQKNLSGLPGGKFSGRAVLGLLLAVVLIWLAFGTFYTVQPNEIALNLTLGRYTGRALPGLNMNWPWPLGSIIKLPVQDQQITEVGYRGDGRGDVPVESLMRRTSAKIKRGPKSQSFEGALRLRAGRANSESPDFSVDS